MRDFATYTDDDLLRDFIEKSDKDAWGFLYNKYVPLLYGVCLKYLKNAEDAQDAVCDIYESVSKKLEKFEVQNFRAWIHTVAKNHCLMQLRKKKQYFGELTDDVMYSVADAHPDVVQTKEAHLVQLENCIEKLPEEQKNMIRLFYLQERCYKDISEETGEELGTVRSRIQNGRRNLKICMEANKI